MRIVHFSDWHGEAFKLPSADLYACTGDMLPNFRTYRREDGTLWHGNMHLLGAVDGPKPFGAEKLPPDPSREHALQTRYLELCGGLRRTFGNPAAPVVCCRGNHDFIDLAALFEGGPVHEASTDGGVLHVSVEGLRIGGIRGIRRHRGRWSDELSDDESASRVATLPDDLDVLVTHAPPRGMLDLNEGEHLGVPAFAEYARRGTRLKAHLFGHVHHTFGMTTSNGVVYSNASLSWNVIDL